MLYRHTWFEESDMSFLIPPGPIVFLARLNGTAWALKPASNTQLCLGPLLASLASFPRAPFSVSCFWSCWASPVFRIQFQGCPSSPESLAGYQWSVALENIFLALTSLLPWLQHARVKGVGNRGSTLGTKWEEGPCLSYVQVPSTCSIVPPDLINQIQK